jgi:hypothetical protein
LSTDLKALKVEQGASIFNVPNRWDWPDIARFSRACAVQ